MNHGKIAVVAALLIALPLPAAAAGPPALPEVQRPSMGAPPIEAGDVDLDASDPETPDAPVPLPAAAPREVDEAPPQVPVTVLQPREVGDPTAAPVKMADPFSGGAGEQGDRWIARPIPRWKKIGLGVSAGVMAASLIGALAVSVPVAQSKNRRGWVYRRVERAAIASLSDGIGDGAGEGIPNDVDPDANDEFGNRINMCALAASTPDPTMPSAVHNRDVHRECLRANQAATAGTAMWVVFGLSTVSTAVFTGLLFAKPGAGRAKTALQRHELRAGIGASPTGGTFSGSLRF